MATVSHSSTATPADVWAVLAHGWYYSNWVVGTSHMRAVEASWPAVGSRLHHASGVWPLVARDETVVEEAYEHRRLVLEAKGRPFGSARIVIELEADGPGCTITLAETPSSGPGSWFDNPVAQAALARRNVEALARLAAIAEGRTEPAD
ncbi:SRPBCC family protein [Jatrophihabitans endophyticus]|uniref:SRPBCC family protein n=1 Tax=Jatrophihabitans endophyticus TaxID=1206085 RepID=UPI001A0E9C9D|nr:SRPBCC family protein [Jatrophihabitans endophyticus]MBE7187104.1 SRPBCC family protein [Jatrophihabitans endophyticus]